MKRWTDRQTNRHRDRRTNEQVENITPSSGSLAWWTYKNYILDVVSVLSLLWLEVIKSIHIKIFTKRMFSNVQSPAKSVIYDHAICYPVY